MSKLSEAEKCQESYHMEDPWYMVFCARKVGHRGKHVFRWASGDDRK